MTQTKALAKRELTEDIRILRSPESLKERVERDGAKAIEHLKDMLYHRSQNTKGLVIEAYTDYDHDVVYEARPMVEKEIKRWAKMQGYTARFSWESGGRVNSRASVMLKQRAPIKDATKAFFSHPVTICFIKFGFFVGLFGNIFITIAKCNGAP